MDKSLKVIEQRGNTFIVKGETAGDYDIWGENTYPRTMRSQDPFQLTVYKKMMSNLDDLSYSYDKGYSVIEGKASILVGCRRSIRI